MKTVTVVAGQTIELGYQYDNYATEVVFPSDIVTPFITNFGSSGVFAIWYRRSGDSLGYPIGDPLVTFDSTNNTITWQVVETDTENPGTAQVQLRYIIEEVCVMSQMFTGVVSDSVDVGEEVPEPLEQWADAIVTAGAGGQPTAVTLASQMTNTSKIYLYMGSEGGYSYNHIYYWNGSAWTDGGAYGGGSTGSGLTEDVKQALLDCFENVAWISDDGQTYVDALEAALYPPANLVSISAVYTQSGTVYDTDTLDSLKSDLVVTAYYDNSTSTTVTNYALSGTLARGTTSAITVTYGGKTTTFNVVVSPYYRFVYSYQDGILSAQDYMTVDENSTMQISDAETMTSTGIRFYSAKTSSASDNKWVRLNFVPNYFTSYAKLTFRAKVVSTGWYQSSNTSSIGPFFFVIGSGEKNAVLGFCKSGSANSPIYLRYFNSSGNVVWGNEVSTTDFHTFVIEIQNNKASISMDGAVQASDIDVHTSTSKSYFQFASINSGVDDVYISDIEYIGD